MNETYQLKYKFTREQLYRFLAGALNLYVEYVDVHGEEPETAAYHAINDMQDALDAEIGLLADGDLTAEEASCEFVHEVQS